MHVFTHCDSHLFENKEKKLANFLIENNANVIFSLNEKFYEIEIPKRGKQIIYMYVVCVMCIQYPEMKAIYHQLILIHINRIYIILSFATSRAIERRWIKCIVILFLSSPLFDQSKSVPISLIRFYYLL